MSARSKFRILHCLRAPVGGLFRHVCDLATAQQSAGHEVAVVCAMSGNALTEARLADLATKLSLGVHRIEASRSVGFADVAATRRVMSLARSLAIDVAHGHGAKGGAYARFAARARRARVAVYTPHGGSLHYPPTSLAGRLVAHLERRLERMGHGIIFESRYAAERYAAQIGPPRVASRIIPNGVGEADFEPVTAAADATDLLFVGELRHLKGVDILLRAIALVATKRPVTATIVGAGPDAAAFQAEVAALNLGSSVRFVGAKPARDAFTMGRILVMPSRAESFPYIVLEAGAAGLPLIATHVGGIPDMIGDAGVPLLPPADVEALATALFDALAAPAALQQGADALRARIRGTFTVATMCRDVLAFYADLDALTMARARPVKSAVAAHDRATLTSV